MTDPTPRELALVEAALKAAANLCELRPIHAAPLVASPIRSLDPAAIVASVPRKLDPELKAALEQAAKTGDLHAVLPNGGVVFINRGEQPEDTADLDCPHCGGSGHKDDVVALSAQEQVEPTDAVVEAAKNLVKVKGRHHSEQAYKQLADAVALLSANQGK